MDSTNLNDLLAMAKMEVSVKNLDATQEYNLAKYGFYVKNNAMFFRDSTKGIKQMSNFAIAPILRIKQIENADPSVLSRTTNVSGVNIMEIVNTDGKKALIRITVKELNDEDKFACIVEEAGNYWFCFTKSDLMKLKRYLYDQIKYVDHIQYLGWQQDGFWAWANGVTLLDETFIPVDEYGRVNVPKGGVDKWYYIEPFSKINENAHSFKDQRKFRHEVSKLNLADWCDDYVSVYGIKSVLNIAAMFTACFSDLITEKTGHLPLIFVGGQPGTGKTEQIKSILSCFEYSPNELNITKITPKIAALKAGLFVNSFVLFDEYRNDIDPQWIELMKSIYNRNAGAIAGEKKSFALPTTSMLFVCGQELPDTDITLYNRCVIIKTERPLHTEDEKIKFNDFKKTDNLGKSHFIDEIISYRQKMKDEFLFVYEEILSSMHNTNLSDYLKNEERIITNYAILLAVYKILWVILGLRINYDVMKEACISCIKTQINAINKFAKL